MERRCRSGAFSARPFAMGRRFVMRLSVEKRWLPEIVEEPSGFLSDCGIERLAGVAVPKRRTCRSRNRTELHEKYGQTFYWLFPLNRRMKTSFQIASAFPQVRSLKLQLLSSWRSCWYESGTNRAEVRTRRFWQCSGGSRKRTRRRLPPRASSPCSHGCRCPWRSASCSARRAPASPWGARR